MKNICWLCGGIRHHDLMYDIVIFDKDKTYENARIVYFGKTCHDEILTQHVLDFEDKDKAMSERMNRHDLPEKEERYSGGTVSPMEVHDKGIVHDLKSQYPKKD